MEKLSKPLNVSIGQTSFDTNILKEADQTFLSTSDQLNYKDVDADIY